MVRLPNFRPHAPTPAPAPLPRPPRRSLWRQQRPGGTRGHQGGAVTPAIGIPLATAPHHHTTPQSSHPCHPPLRLVSHTHPRATHARVRKSWIAGSASCLYSKAPGVLYTSPPPPPSPRFCRSPDPTSTFVSARIAVFTLECFKCDHAVQCAGALPSEPCSSCRVNSGLNRLHHSRDK